MTIDLGLDKLDLIWSNYIFKKQEQKESAERDLETARHIYHNSKYLKRHTDESLRKRLLIEFNPGIDDSVFGKLTVLSNYAENLGNRNDLINYFGRLRLDFIKRNIDEKTYFYFDGLTIPELIEDHFKAKEYKPKKHYLARIVSDILIKLGKD